MYTTINDSRTLVERASLGKMHSRHYFSPQQNGAKKITFFVTLDLSITISPSVMVCVCVCLSEILCERERERERGIPLSWSWLWLVWIKKLRQEMFFLVCLFVRSTRQVPLSWTQQNEKKAAEVQKQLPSTIYSAHHESVCWICL